MATVFSDIAKQAAYGNSLIVQRYHGGLATTLVSDLTLGGLGGNANVVYLCPIPWHARIIDISYILSADGDATTQPVGSFYIRGMKGKVARTSTDLSSLEYTKIVATTNDANRAASAAGGTTKSLAGWTISATNEYPLFSGVTMTASSTISAGTENHLVLPFDARTCTCSEAYAFQTAVSEGSSTKTINVFADNAVGYADTEHYGMLTWVNTTAQAAGTATTKILMKVTYVEPSPSGIVTGQIVSNS